MDTVCRYLFDGQIKIIEFGQIITINYYCEYRLAPRGMVAAGRYDFCSISLTDRSACCVGRQESRTDYSDDCRHFRNINRTVFG